ncbi:glycerol-3-phosphate 1-O-acyltransferase PlsY [candidate division KSB1 bacterium]|nr:glycerol-3-phosphate 1-O-acyltransferase PlsY [candidate division KSB1 bacterium]
MISLLIIMISSYLLGSVPWSIIFSKATRGIDIREYGSGNAGATNVFRVLGWKTGIVVLILDVLKGFVAAYYISQIRIDPIPLHGQTIQIIAGFMAVVGHIWTLFANFKGGKGVGAGAGMLLALNPTAALICLIIFGIVLFLTKIVSVSSMAAALSFPIVLIMFKFYTNHIVTNVLIYLSVFISLLILFTHRSNIKRLLAGNENKITDKKK